VINPKAKKHFGQNFLVDEFIIGQIVDSIAPQQSDHLVEIGPGTGAITLPLLPFVAQIDAIELDRDIIPILEKSAGGIGKLVIHQSDALSFDLKNLTSRVKSLRVVGNLPYNISTPLLFHLFDQQAFIIDMHFMLQKEVAQRLASAPGSKQYGRLSIMAQYFCDIEVLIDVPPYAFSPPPKVESMFIRLTPKLPSLVANDITLLDKVVKEAFGKRRKTVSNALKGVISPEQMTSLGIDPRLRPEQLSLENYVKMSNIL
jgi:16S rRNA (adenine1518-N6/adenine1519-N6)-dimethyltransferase